MVEQNQALNVGTDQAAIIPEAVSGQAAAANAEYVTDTEYTWGFYGDMAPISIAYIALVNGIVPPDIHQPFTYLELGCGNGMSANVFAAAYPKAEFHAVDLNARHIENARGLSEQGKLDNIHWHHSTFGDIDLSQIPDMDFIVLHGVYSWVSPDVRSQIRDVVRRKLKPGGIVYVSYNSLPGWASRLPLREIMLSYASNRGLSSVDMAREGLKYLKFLTEKNALFFHENPAARSTVETMAKHDVRYLPHEYFNAHWDSFYCEDVIGDFTQAGCVFLGCSPLVMNIRDLTIPLAFHDVFKTAPDRIVYETHKSYVLNEGFRRDLFVRLPFNRMSPEQITEQFDRIYVGALNPIQELTYQHTFFSGQVTFDTPVYRKINEILRDKVISFADLRADPEIAATDLRTVIFALNVLLCTGRFNIFSQPLHKELAPDSNFTIANPFTRALLDRRLTEDQATPLASEVFGTAAMVNTMSALALLAFDRHAPGQTPEAWAQEFLARHNRFINSQDKKIEDKDQTIAILKDRFSNFRTAETTYLSKLGILAASGS